MEKDRRPQTTGDMPDDRVSNLAKRFRRFQLRGAKRAEKLGIRSEDIPNLLRQGRGDMTSEELHRTVEDN